MGPESIIEGFCIMSCRDRDWNRSSTDQGPPGTEPAGDIEVSSNWAIGLRNITIYSQQREHYSSSPSEGT